ncbi:dipeptidase [Virgibacillus sp. W0430]|uniref:dipeptidase n=1 Tax=Virgibacillus sp. W0430 TaxID=3391580 RepID=UPI003F48DE80
MKIIDAHCDALYKLQEAKRQKEKGELDYTQSSLLDTNFNRLKQGNVFVQFYAIFIYPTISSDEIWQFALEQIELFHTEVVRKNPQIRQIKKWHEIDELQAGQIGAVLTLEGADAFGNDLSKLRHLYKEGVLSIGLTWNNANLCADGVGEPRGGGLTLLGKEMVKLNNAHNVFTDVSHLSIKGFWEVMELADYPIATHSNVRKLCDHPRNLYDDQIKEMVARDGLIHVVFNPPFIRQNSEKASVSDLIDHIDYLCSLGGVKNIGFGSDFDGIDHFIHGLENSSKYQHLINELLKRFSETHVRGFAYQNFLDHRPETHS